MMVSKLGSPLGYLLLNTTQTTEGLKQVFNEWFPFLKMEFLRSQNENGKGFSKDNLVKVNEPIIKLQKNLHSGKIAIYNQLTVTELENIFLKKFGLNMQVFRKSGSVWLQTTATDHWTLQQQNEEGKSLAHQLYMDHENPEQNNRY